MKKLPRGVYLSLFLLLVAVIAGAILSAINMLTAPIIEENKLKELQKSFAEIGVTITAEENVELLENVTGLYSGTFEEKECYIITTTNGNKFTTVSLISVIEKTTGLVLTGKVTGAPTITTHNMDGSFTNDNLGLVGATKGEDLNLISNATFSFNSVKACLDLAVQQFKAVAGEIQSVPSTAKLNLTSQVIEKDVFNKFTANLTVNSNDFTNQEVNIVFTHDFTTKANTFVSSDVELNEELKELCMSKITAPKDYIKSCVDNEFVVITNMKYGSVFTTTVKVNESGVIESYAVTTSAGFTGHWENRDAESNSFIASVPNTNINDIDSLTYVSGATFTTNAFKNALQLVKSYVALGGAE